MHKARSCMCFFKNPETGEPAGKLIDLSGLKGFRINDAEVSEIHANFIINRGSATADDILKVAEKVCETVYQKFGVTLAPEVKIIGE
jgi:UDP-N-acetylmuramate dehydrogenase